jgi:hypothetical protein
MKVVKLVLFPARTGEKVNWGHTGFKIRDMVVQEDGMGNSHWPKS